MAVDMAVMTRAHLLDVQQVRPETVRHWRVLALAPPTGPSAGSARPASLLEARIKLL